MITMAVNISMDGCMYDRNKKTKVENVNARLKMNGVS